MGFHGGGLNVLDQPQPALLEGAGHLLVGNIALELDQDFAGPIALAVGCGFHRGQGLALAEHGCEENESGPAGPGEQPAGKREFEQAVGGGGGLADGGRRAGQSQQG